MIQPHIDKILKLLMKSGKMNPSEHERAAAREAADRLMAKHGVTIGEMRALYWKWSGLTPPPSKSRPGPSPFDQRFYQPKPPVQRCTGAWDKRSKAIPWVVPRPKKKREGARAKLLRRVEEAVAKAFPAAPAVVPVDLVAFQDCLKREGIHCVLHHNPLLLATYGYLQVTKVGFVVDGDPKTYAEGGRIYIGLDRLLRLGLVIDPRSRAHHAAALEGLAGLSFGKDKKPLRACGYPEMVGYQDRIDAALNTAGGDLTAFLEELRNRGLALEVDNPGVLLAGQVPSVAFNGQESHTPSGDWLGAAYTWDGLMARGLRVDPKDKAQMRVLYGLRPKRV